MNYKLSIVSNNHKLLLVYCHYLKAVLKKFDIVARFSSQPMQIKRITLLKSPHVSKKAKESFELRTYKTSLFFKMKRKFQRIMILDSILKNKPKFIKLKISFTNLRRKKRLKTKKSKKILKSTKLDSVKVSKKDVKAILN